MEEYSSNLGRIKSVYNLYIPSHVRPIGTPFEVTFQGEIYSISCVEHQLNCQRITNESNAYAHLNDEEVIKKGLYKSEDIKIVKIQPYQISEKLANEERNAIANLIWCWTK